MARAMVDPAYLGSMGGARGNPPGRKRPRGNIQTLPSGSLRVRVYAGVDVLTGKGFYLSEVIAAGPDADDLAEETRARLVRQVAENRQPKTNAPLSYLISEHLRQANIGLRTKATLEGYVRKHIAPSDTRPGVRAVGELNWGELKPKVFDDFYAELRRCRDHCDGKPTVIHRTDRPHRCTAKCKVHACKPLQLVPRYALRRRE